MPRTEDPGEGWTATGTRREKSRVGEDLGSDPPRHEGGGGGGRREERGSGDAGAETDARIEIRHQQKDGETDLGGDTDAEWREAQEAETAVAEVGV